MKIASIYADKTKRNYARQGPLHKDGDKSKIELAVSLIKGWWSMYPTTVTPLSKEEVAAAIVDLEAEHKAVILSELEYVVNTGDKTVTIVPAEYRLAWEYCHLDAKGKILKPEFGNVYAFRRIDCLVLAVAIQMKLKLPLMNDIPCAFDAKGNVSDTGIPVIVKNYESEFERMEDCALENFKKKTGVSEVDTDWPTIAKVVREMRDIHRKVKGKPVIQSRVVDTFGTRHTGQKAFYIMQLDTMYPQLNVIDNIINGKTPGGPLDRMDLLELTNRDKKSLDDVARYLANPKEERAKKAKRMSDKDLDAFIKEVPSTFLKEIMRAVRTDDSETIFAAYSYGVKIDQVAAGFIQWCNERRQLKESTTPTGESLPDLTPEAPAAALPNEVPAEVPAPAVVEAAK